MKNEDKRYSMEEVKCFLEELFNSVISNYNLNVKFLLLTNEEYFDSEIYKYYCNNGMVDYVNDYLNGYPAFYINSIKTILIRLDFSNSLDNEKELKTYTLYDVIYLVFEIFHELGHFWQDNLNSYDNVLDIIYELTEKGLLLEHDFYYNNWNRFYREAIADLYGINMTIELLKKNPYIYDKYKDWLQCIKAEIECRVNTYDFNFIFDRFNSMDKSIYRNGLFNIIYKYNMKDFNNIEDIVLGFKSLRFEEMIIPILSSDAFLKTIDFNKLSDNEIDIMIDVLNTVCKEYLKKIDYLKSYINNYNEDNDYYDIQWYYLNNRLCIIEDFLDKFNDLKRNNNKLCYKKL